MIEKHRREIPNFDERFAQDLAELDIALKIARARETRKLTQRALAERAGVTQAMIARLEHQPIRNTTIKTLNSVVNALGYRLRIEIDPVPRRA